MNDLTLEWHSTPQLWVAYRGCGCPECIVYGMGKTKEAAERDLLEREESGWIKSDARL